MLPVIWATHILAVPSIILLWCQKKWFHTFIGMMTIAASAIENILVSFRLDFFYIKTIQWHHVVAIGMPMCFVLLFIELMVNSSQLLNQYLAYSGFLLCIFSQDKEAATGKPYTLLPIGLFLLGYISRLIIRREIPHYNLGMVLRAVLCLMFSGWCYFVSSGEHIGVYHWLWYCAISMAFFFFCQVLSQRDKEVSFFDLLILGRIQTAVDLLWRPTVQESL